MALQEIDEAIEQNLTQYLDSRSLAHACMIGPAVDIAGQDCGLLNNTQRHKIYKNKQQQ